MKSITGLLLAAVVLLPASQVKQVETERGYNILLERTEKAITQAQALNKGHAWVSYKGFNIAQAYALQRELEAKGYTLDISPRLFWIGW